MSEIKSFIVGLLVVTLWPLALAVLFVLILLVSIYTIGNWIRGE
jgi:hypothetical protein